MLPKKFSSTHALLFFYKLALDKFRLLWLVQKNEMMLKLFNGHNYIILQKGLKATLAKRYAAEVLISRKRVTCSAMLSSKLQSHRMEKCVWRVFCLYKMKLYYSNWYWTVPTLVTDEGSGSYTGIIIGIMTFIIVFLVGAIAGMSVRNCKQSGGLSILPKSFGGIRLKVNYTNQWDAFRVQGLNNLSSYFRIGTRLWHQGIQ